MNVNFSISFPWGAINSEKQLCAAENSCKLRILGVEFSSQKPPLTQIRGCQCQAQDREEKSVQVDFD